MATLFRYLLILVGALLALLLVATLAIVLFVDPNDYRDDILDALSEATGRQVSIDGDIELGAFPCCSLQLGPLAVGNPRGWQSSGEDFVRIESADVSVRLWPLLTQGELSVGQVVMDGLMVDLVSRRDGSVNWEFESSSAPRDSATIDEEPGATPLALNVDGVAVRNAQLRYSDLASGDRIELNEIDFSTGRMVPGESTGISLSLLAVGLLPEQPVRLTIDADAILSATGDQAELQDLSVQIDDARMTGWLKLTDLAAQKLAFDLRVDRFNADTYLTDEPDSGGAGAGGNINNERIDIPVQALRELNLDGTLGIAELVFNGAQLDDVLITVAAANGALRMHPLTARLYDGSYAGDVRLDVRGNKPKLAVDERLTGVTVAALLADTSDMDNFAGHGDVRITATANGNTVGELLEKLSGDAAFELQDGLYSGADLWYEIRKARALLKRETVPPAPENPQTELSEFSGTLKFAGGQATNQDFQAALPFLRLTGAGSINLLAAALDYRLQARVVDDPQLVDAAGDDNTQQAAQQLKGLTVPISIKGPLDEPRVRVDLGGLLKESAREAAKEKVRDRLEEKLKKKFKLFD